MPPDASSHGSVEGSLTYITGLLIPLDPSLVRLLIGEPIAPGAEVLATATSGYAPSSSSMSWGSVGCPAAVIAGLLNRLVSDRGPGVLWSDVTRFSLPGSRKAQSSESREFSRNLPAFSRPGLVGIERVQLEAEE